MSKVKHLRKKCQESSFTELWIRQSITILNFQNYLKLFSLIYNGRQKVLAMRTSFFNQFWKTIFMSWLWSVELSLFWQMFPTFKAVHWTYNYSYVSLVKSCSVQLNSSHSKNINNWLERSKLRSCKYIVNVFYCNLLNEKM